MAKDKYTSPKGGNRGCLCEDKETYSKECCKGELIEQGVGATVQQHISNVVNTNEPRTISSSN
jgi:hypothetical protein